MTHIPDEADLTITDKGKRLLATDNSLTPSATLTLELIARFPGLPKHGIRDIYVALLRKMSMDDALIYVKSGELERDAQ